MNSKNMILDEFRGFINPRLESGFGKYSLSFKLNEIEKWSTVDEQPDHINLSSSFSEAQLWQLTHQNMTNREQGIRQKIFHCSHTLSNLHSHTPPEATKFNLQ